MMAAVAGCRRAPEPPRPPPAPPPRAIGKLNRALPILVESGARAATAEGRPVLELGDDGKWRPLGPDALPARIDLDDGTLFVGAEFAGAGETAARLRWIEPAHRASEIAEREREMADEAARLPDDARARIAPLLPVVAVVSSVEGRFGDPATNPRDTAASLGIFQWAMARHGEPEPGSTLERFFSRLKERAATGDQLAAGAWAQCRAAKLDVRGGKLTLGGRRATGVDVEKKLAAPMGTGALKSYQLVAARDWIDQVRATVIRPGYRGGWDGYNEAEGGRLITLTVGGHTAHLRARAHATVGEVFSSAAALATAVNLGVNRPRYVESALWRAVSPEDARAQIENLIAQLDTGGDAERSATEEALRALLWPRPRDLDEAKLVREFTRRALELYRPAERERRARRLATAEALADAPAPSLSPSVGEAPQAAHLGPK